MASVREELGEYPVTIDHEAYSARGPILAVRVSNSRGARTSKDFDFKAEDDLSNARLVNAIVRLIRERFETASSETKE
jgi:hypothetical protein